MPKKVFDISHLQANINEYIKSMNDLITTAEEVQKYSEFCGAIFEINAITQTYFTVNKNGQLPLMNQAQKIELRNAYRKAIEQGSALLGIEDTGKVGEGMNALIQEMLPLLQADNIALDQASVKGPMTLSEIIENGRQQVVDLGNQESYIQSGITNARQNIIVQNGNTFEEGYFTPTKKVENYDKKAKRKLEEIRGKYPAEFGSVIDILIEQNLNHSFMNNQIHWDSIDYSALWKMKPDQREEELDYKMYSAFLGEMGISAEQYEDIINHPEGYKFLDEIRTTLEAIKNEYDTYLRGDFALDLKEGDTIDRRNIGMYRMGCLLGKPNLVAEARPMTVIQNGVPVQGTFMANAEGMDVNKLTANSPELKYTIANFENPAVFDDIAAMQVIDYICGNVDRHAGNFILRFEPKDAENAKLVGITLIDNDMSLSHVQEESIGLGNYFTRARQMGVIGEDTYNALKLMTKEQMEIMLSDCGIDQKDIDFAWERKEYLLNKIEADKEYYADKAPGFTEEGRIRIIPKNEWSNYTLESLARTHHKSQFYQIDDIAKGMDFKAKFLEQEKQKKASANEMRKALGIPVTEPAPDKKAPVGIVVANPALQDNNAPEAGLQGETIKFVIPNLEKIPHVGNDLNCRYCISYVENGKEHQLFYTTPQDGSFFNAYNEIFDNTIRKYPQFESELNAIRDYYSTNDLGNVIIPSTLSRLPLEEIGFSKEKAEELQNNNVFKTVYEKLGSNISDISTRNALMEANGMVLSEGSRIEMRNVAMSDACEILGLGDLLAKSKPAQVMCNNRVIDGVVMENAEGVNIHNIPGNHPMSQIPEEKIDEVFNTAEGLKGLADLQMLDYICLNIDRHNENLFYRFEGLGTDNPRFKGPQGIDNDTSFSAEVPEPGHSRDKLPALNDMQVISEEMFAMINNPEKIKSLKETHKARGLSDEEIAATEQRIENIKKAVSENRIRVVKKEEWGIGQNSFKELGSTKGSFFTTIRRTAINISKKGAAYKQAQNGVVEPYQQNNLKFAKCVKVDDFGATALSNKELADLERKANKKFIDDIKQSVNSAQIEEPNNERDTILQINEKAKQLLAALNAADPTLSLSSRKYKNLKSSVSKLVKLSNKAAKKMKSEEDELSAIDTHKIMTQLNKVIDDASIYKNKKDSEELGGKELSVIEKARRTASISCISTCKELNKMYQKTIAKQISKNNPLNYVHKRMNKAQRELSGVSGEQLLNTVAGILYYKGLSRIDVEVKSTDVLKKAVQIDVVKAELKRIKASPAFEQFRQMPEKELRNLAAGKNADKLMTSYVRETAKHMQQQKAQKGRNANQNAERGPEGPAVGK